MREFLQSLGYTILRWEEWAEDHLEYEVVTPHGVRVIAEDVRLLVPANQALVLVGDRVLPMAA